MLAERSPALPRVADDGCAFKALRPHPHAGQAGGYLYGCLSTDRPSICPDVLGLNYLIGISQFAADRDRCKFSDCWGMNLRARNELRALRTLKREATPCWRSDLRLCRA